MAASHQNVVHHKDGGILNLRNNSHVNAALQVLLHIPPFIDFVIGDVVHRDQCKAVLKCSTCELFTVWNSINENRNADPGYFVDLWLGLSELMEESRQGDPYEVLFTLLTRMRLEHFQRNNITVVTEELLHETATGRAFEGEQIMDISCQSCGEFQHGKKILSIEIQDDMRLGLPTTLISNLYAKQSIMCPVCRRKNAVGTSVDIVFPPFLLIHCSRKCGANFSLPPALKLQQSNFKFVCAVAHFVERNINCSQFYSLCPDGRGKVIEDTKVSPISVAKLLMPGIVRNSELTLIYSNDDVTQSQKQSKTHHIRETPIDGSNRGLKVTSYPKFCADLMEDLMEDLPTHRTFGTQTDLPNPKTSAAVQCTIPEAFVSFNKCKKHAKFEFFTGLNLQDFEAFFDLLGGDSTIRYLKMQYQLSTPKKVRQSQFSGKDRLLMFLLRLRRGLPIEELSVIFNISTTYVADICYAVMRHIYLTFKAMEDRTFVSAAKQQKSKQKVMLPLNNLRVILDGGTFFIQTPSNFEQQGNTFSNYKKTNGLLFIFGVSCTGGTIFCSQGFEANISEKDAIIQSGLLDRLDKGDSVLTDRGFQITAELQAIGVHLYKPPLLGDRTCLTPEEESFNKTCAAARIYVEHAIADVKDNRLLQGMIPSTLVPSLPSLVYIAAFLRNFKSSRVRDYTLVEDSSTEKQLTTAEDEIV